MAGSDSEVVALLGCLKNGDRGMVVSQESKYAEIIVVRHGETDWNRDKRFQGQLDVELNHTGRQQAVAVAERLAREPRISAVYSSDLKRAFDTAETIARSCGTLDVTKDSNLRERHIGDLQGLFFREASRMKPRAYKALLSKSDDKEIPGGGESFNQLYHRCTSALANIAQKHIGDRIVVVTHGAAMEALRRRASPHVRPEGKILNASVNVLHIWEDDQWSIKLWNDVSHLEQAGFLDSGFGGGGNSC